MTWTYPQTLLLIVRGSELPLVTRQTTGLHQTATSVGLFIRYTAGAECEVNNRSELQHFPYRIRSLVTLRDVKEGEELTVDYDYQVNNKFTPYWYSKLYHAFYGEK